MRELICINMQFGNLGLLIVITLFILIGFIIGRGYDKNKQSKHLNNQMF